VEGVPEIMYVTEPHRQEPLVTSVAPAFEAGFARSSAAILKRGFIKRVRHFLIEKKRGDRIVLVGC
jgi:hypothetical protein